MSRAEHSRFYLRLPAYLLGLVDDDERRELERALAADDDLRRALDELRVLGECWGDDELDHPAAVDVEAAVAAPDEGGRAVLAHALHCDDCRFVAALALAERDAARAARADPAPTAARPSMVRTALRSSRVAWSTAAAVLLLAVGVTWWQAPGPDVATHTRVFALDLRQLRTDSAATSIELRPAEHPILELVGECRVAGPELRWELETTRGRTVVTGRRAFAQPSPKVRTVRVPVPSAALSTGEYVFLVSPAAPGDEATAVPPACSWSFAVRVLGVDAD